MSADIVAVLREYADPDFTLSVPDFAKRAMLDAANEIAGLRGTMNAASREVAHRGRLIQGWIEIAEAGGVEADDLTELKRICGKSTTLKSQNGQVLGKEAPMSDLTAEMIAARDKLASRIEKATPLPWFYNGYSAVHGGNPAPDGVHMDDWLEAVDASDKHTFERHGECKECEVLGINEGYHGCKLYYEQYDRDSHVASVPALYGDTAVRRHQGDADLIADMSKLAPIVLEILDEQIAENKKPRGSGYQVLGAQNRLVLRLARAIVPQSPDVRLGETDG